MDPGPKGWTDEEVEKAFAGFAEASDRAREVVAEATARGFGGEVDTLHHGADSSVAQCVCGLHGLLRLYGLCGSYGLSPLAGVTRTTTTRYRRCVASLLFLFS